MRPVGWSALKCLILFYLLSNVNKSLSAVSCQMKRAAVKCQNNISCQNITATVKFKHPMSNVNCRCENVNNSCQMLTVCEVTSGHHWRPLPPRISLLHCLPQTLQNLCMNVRWLHKYVLNQNFAKTHLMND